MVFFPKVLQEVICPVPGCPSVAHSAGRLCEHFMFRHFRSKVAVVQEGKETLPCCEMCGMKIPAWRLIRHKRTARWDRNTQMMWRRWDMAVAAKCSEAMFILIGEDKLERIEGVGRFKYLGRLLDRSYKNWPAVLHNIMKARKVRGRLGKILWREGAEPAILEKFHRAVVQVVLLFGAGKWVLTEELFQPQMGQFT